MKNWELIAQYTYRNRLPVNIRQQLLHDSLTLALSGRLCYAYAFNVSKFIEQEPEPAVWKVYFGLAKRLRVKFQGTPVAPKFDVSIFIRRSTQLDISLPSFRFRADIFKEDVEISERRARTAGTYRV